MDKITISLFTFFLFPLFITAQTAGSLDSTFSNDGVFLTKVDSNNTALLKILHQSDGKIVAIGFTHPSTSLSDDRAIVLRFNSDGTPDSTFSEDGVFMMEDESDWGVSGHILADGSILVVGQGLYPNGVDFIKLTPSGETDNSFGTGGLVINTLNVVFPNVKQSFLQPDGKIVVLGIHDDLNGGKTRAFAARYLDTGEPDLSFGIQGVRVVPEPNSATTIRVQGGNIQPDGKILLTGLSGVTPQTADWYFVRFTTDGQLDPEFGTNGIVRKSLGNNTAEGCGDVVFLENGQFIAGGYAAKWPGYHFTLARFNEDGTQDLTYGLGGKAQIGMNCCYSGIYDLAQQADGKIVACGYSSEDNIHYNFAVARFKPNGAIDQTFGESGRVILQFEPAVSSQRATSLVIQPDGKIVITGYTDYGENWGTAIVLRLNPGSVLVNTHNPVVNAVELITISPNPVYGDMLQVNYTLTTAATVSMSVYDITGRKVADLPADEWQSEGENTIQLPLPSGLPAGSYFLHIKTASGTAAVQFLKISY